MIINKSWIKVCLLDYVCVLICIIEGQYDKNICLSKIFDIVNERNYH